MGEFSSARCPRPAPRSSAWDAATASGWSSGGSGLRRPNSSTSSPSEYPISLRYLYPQGTARYLCIRPGWFPGHLSSWSFADLVTPGRLLSFLDCSIDLQHWSISIYFVSSSGLPESDDCVWTVTKSFVLKVKTSLKCTFSSFCYLKRFSLGKQSVLNICSNEIALQFNYLFYFLCSLQACPRFTYTTFIYFWRLPIGRPKYLFIHMHIYNSIMIPVIRCHLCSLL